MILFCFIPSSLPAKYQFYYIEIGLIRKSNLHETIYNEK